LNPKQREVSSLNGKVGYLRVTCNVIPNAMKLATVWNDYKHTLRVRNWWKKLKNHTPYLFSSKKYRKFGKKVIAQSTSDLLPKHQTSEISLKKSDLMLKHQKWQHWVQCIKNHISWSPSYMSV